VSPINRSLLVHRTERNNVLRLSDLLAGGWGRFARRRNGKIINTSAAGLAYNVKAASSTLYVCTHILIYVYIYIYSFTCNKPLPALGDARACWQRVNSFGRRNASGRISSAEVCARARAHTHTPFYISARTPVVNDKVERLFLKRARKHDDGGGPIGR